MRRAPRSRAACRPKVSHGRSTSFPITLRSDKAFSASAPGKKVGHVGAMGLRLAREPGAPIDTADVAALEQHQVERKLGDVARRKTDDEEAPLPGERA